MSSNKKPSKFTFANIVLILFGAVCLLFLAIAFYAPSVASSFYDYPSGIYQAPANISATLYNSMSPFIAIVAALLTFMAFWMQYNANQEMLKNNARQEVERLFYEMLHIHKENVKELRWDRWSIVESSNPKYVCEDETLGKGKFFYNNKYGFKPIMGNEVFEYYEAEFYIIEACLMKAIEVVKRNPNVNLSFNHKNINDYKAAFAFAYKIFYEGIDVIENSFLENASFFFRACEKKNSMMKKILGGGNWFGFKKKKFLLNSECLFNDYNGYIFLYCYFFICDNRNKLESYSFKSSFRRVFGGGLDLFEGHSSDLNHYYRHLYQMVDVVANYDENIIEKEEKRKYLRMLRPLLTSTEQLMLFCNWFSGYGSEWENEKNHFFTEFRMIYNMDVECSDIFKKFKYDKIVNMIKSENPGYRDYENDYLFELEKVKIKTIASLYEKNLKSNGLLFNYDLLPVEVMEVIGLRRYFKAREYVSEKYRDEWPITGMPKEKYKLAVDDIQNYIKQMFIWED